MHTTEVYEVTVSEKIRLFLPVVHPEGVDFLLSLSRTVDLNHVLVALVKSVGYNMCSSYNKSFQKKLRTQHVLILLYVVYVGRWRCWSGSTGDVS